MLEIHWDSLRFLLALSARGSVADTARSLNVAPDVVVKRLVSLETALRLKLFVSLAQDGTVGFTDMGRYVLAQAEKLSEDINALAAKAQYKNQKQSITIGSTEGFGTHWIVPRLPALQKQHPDLAVSLSLGSPGDDPVDFYMRPTTYILGLQNRLVGTMPFYFYASEAYIAERGNPSSFEDLVENHAVVLAAYYFDEGPWVQWARILQDRAKSIALYTNSSSAVVSAVRHGLGVALMSGYAQKIYPDIVRCTGIDNWHDFTLPVVVSYDPSRVRLPHVDIVMKFFLKEAAQGI